MACRPSSWQSKCAGSFWKKVGGPATATLLGQQMNTWSQLWKISSYQGAWSTFSEGTHPCLSSLSYLSKKTNSFAAICFVITSRDEGWHSLRVFKCVEACVSRSLCKTWNAFYATRLHMYKHLKRVQICPSLDWRSQRRKTVWGKDIWMWVSLVGRLGYCSTHGLRKENGCMLSSPNRPWSMAAGGTLRDNRSPMTGCPPWHQCPLCSHSGGL